MNWDRVRAIATKEWIEVKANRMIVLGMAALPLSMVGITLVTAKLLADAGGGDLGLEEFVVPERLSHLTAKDAFIVLMNDQYILYLWLIPTLLPVSVAAYSIVGEKRERSLEPLLSSPVTTRELLVGKALTAIFVPTILGWASYGAVALGTWGLCNGAIALEVVRPIWLVGTICLTPLLALLGTTSAMMISTRATDVRSAQSIAGLGVLPIVGIASWVLVGQVYLTLNFVLVALIVILGVNLVLIRLTEKLFDREQILTRWK